MTVTTVRPDGTVFSTNVGTTGAVAAWTVLDDSPDNDTTRAQGTANAAEARMTLTTTTVGATNRVMQVLIRARGAHEGTDVGHAEQVNLRLHDPTTGKSGRNNSFSTASTTFSQYTAGWETAAPAGGAWTQAVIDRLQARAYWLRSVNGFFLLVSELYVDIDIYAQPAVSAVTVTGATTTTTPDFSYTFTQSQGLSQEARQVKVFSAAQYGATGFDPATSTAVWDSGVVHTAETTGTVGVNLTNGTTYKVYVAAGIDWPVEQGLGSVWYSTWVASSGFTIAVLPPPAPTITVTQQTTLPSYRNLIRVSAPINLLTANQASLETDTTGWTALANCTITRSTAYFVDGAASLQMSSTASGTMTAETSTRPQVEPGAQMTALATVRSAVSARTVRVGIRFYDVTGALIGSTNFGTGVTDATGADTTPTATATAPATTYSASVVLEVQSTGGAAEIHRWDKIDLHYGSSTTWSAGGYKDGAVITVYRSQRISSTLARGPARNWLHPQLFSAGALTNSTDGWYARQANDQIRSLPMDRAAPEATVQVSAGMIEWAIRVGASSYLDIGAPDGVATDGLQPYLMPAVPAKAMVASIWLWADTAVNVRLGVIFTDRYNTQVGSTTFTATTGLTTTEQKVSVTATPPAGSVFARWLIEDTGSVTGVRVYAAMPRWRPSSEPDEAWPGQVFAWETETVRALTATTIADGQNDLAVYDHEPPAGRPVLYWARVTATTSTGQAIASIDGTAVPVYNTAPASTLLKDPFQPENAMVTQIMPDHDLTQDEDATEFHPLGTDGDPVVWRDWISGENGTIAVFASNELERYRLDQLHPSARPLLIQWAEGGNTYVRITKRGKTPQLVQAGLWRAVFDYVQTERP